ncbi:transposase [Leuconostoc holzapfelii]|uniref:Transposase n=1 Tax=Leuconostoc holzapfelii TaxID=434464 RepID=A0A846ZFA4_9LACO|nr:transposase [Leuconostoc holzapfelii]NKZ17582.1 transposase [Leuconostoc holzapfelii]
MTQSKNFRYANDFKESMVALYQSGRSATSLAKEYGVSVTTLTKWIKNAGTQTVGDKTYTNAEVKQLQKENARLKEELDILKRAAVLLAKR